jgi:hypothetical protein
MTSHTAVTADCCRYSEYSVTTTGDVTAKRGENGGEKAATKSVAKRVYASKIRAITGF